MVDNTSLDKLVIRRHKLYEQLEELMKGQLAALKEEQLIDTYAIQEEDKLHSFHSLVDQQESLKNDIDTLQGQIQEHLAAKGIKSLEESIFSASLKPIIDSSKSLIERLGSIQGQILELLKQQFDTLTSDMRKTNQYKQVMNSYYNINPSQQVAVYFDEKK